MITRLPVEDIKVSRPQRKSLHAWNRHILGASYVSQAARYHPKTREQKKKDQQTFDLPSAIHAAENSYLPIPSPKPEHHYTVTLELSTYTDEKYYLFEQYQRLIHHDRSSKAGFRSFLCDSPLVAETRNVPVAKHLSADKADRGSDSALVMREMATEEQKLGSYHQLHRLDGRLIAMSVLDLLPHGVSAVYFIYIATPFANPAPSSPTTSSAMGTERTTNFSAFSPGTLSALREASYALTHSHKYYYMGYYIHSCTKMRYKSSFKPQYVLDPCTYEWNVFHGTEGVGAMLEKYRFVSMSRLWLRDTASASAVEENEKEKSEEKENLLFPTALLALRAPSLFSLHLPGIPTIGELQSQIDLADVRLKVQYGKNERIIVPISSMSGFTKGSWEDGRSLKGAVAELVAAVGAEVAMGLVVEL